MCKQQYALYWETYRRVFKVVDFVSIYMIKWEEFTLARNCSWTVKKCQDCHQFCADFSWSRLFCIIRNKLGKRFSKLNFWLWIMNILIKNNYTSVVLPIIGLLWIVIFIFFLILGCLEKDFTQYVFVNRRQNVCRNRRDERRCYQIS